MVSIIIPVYNIEKYIKKCVDSVMNQTYKDLEIIIVNDGSTDSSYEVCMELAKEDSRIRVISQENGGLSKARNTGIDNANGEWILFLDGDDWLDSYCIEKCIGVSSASTDIVMFPYIREYPDNPRKVELFFQNQREFDRTEIEQYIIRRLIGPMDEELRVPNRMEDLNPVWDKLYRRELISDIRFVDTKEIGTEDLWFNILTFDNAQNVSYTNETYYHYNKDNSGALTRNYNPYLFKGWKKLYGYIYSYICKKYSQEMYLTALANRIIINLLALSRNVVTSNLDKKEKILELKTILNDEIYHDCFGKFDIKSLSLVWGFFYSACKFKRYYFIVFMMTLAEKLKKYS